MTSRNAPRASSDHTRVITHRQLAVVVLIAGLALFASVLCDEAIARNYPATAERFPRITTVIAPLLVAGCVGLGVAAAIPV